MSACIPRIPPKHLISQMGDALEERDVTIAKLRRVARAALGGRWPPAKGNADWITDLVLDYESVYGVPGEELWAPLKAALDALTEEG